VCVYELMSECSSVRVYECLERVGGVDCFASENNFII
jgi:hypothetical protein